MALSCTGAVTLAAAARIILAVARVVCKAATWREGREKSEQIAHRAACAVRRDTELFERRILPVQPESGEAEPGRAGHVPAVRRYEHDLGRRRVEGLRAERISGARRFVCAHGVDRKHVVEQAAHAGAFERDVEHLWI